jgi:hypothetical protein
VRASGVAGIVAFFEGARFNGARFNGARFDVRVDAVLADADAVATQPGCHKGLTSRVRLGCATRAEPGAIVTSPADGG